MFRVNGCKAAGGWEGEIVRAVETESALLLVRDMHQLGETICKSVDERAVNYGAFGSQIGH